MLGQRWGVVESGGSGAFTPKSVAGCVLWLDGNDPAGNGVQPSDGSALSSWVDKSSQVNTATQATGANQPIFKANQINGNGVVQFAPPQFMNGVTSGFSSGSTGRTFFAVINTSSLASVEYFFSYGSTGSNLAFATSVTTLGRLNLNNFGANATATVTTMTTGTNYIVEFRYPGGGNLGTVKEYVNAIDQLVGANANPVNTGLVSSSIGGVFFSGTLRWTGQLGELIMYNSSLSSTDESAVTSYLSTKWGIAV